MSDFGNIHFDSGFESGIEFERKDILRLLEKSCDCDKNHPNVVIHNCQNRIAIALIKGKK